MTASGSDRRHVLGQACDRVLGSGRSRRRAVPELAVRRSQPQQATSLVSLVSAQLCNAPASTATTLHEAGHRVLTPERSLGASVAELPMFVGAPALGDAGDDHRAGVTRAGADRHRARRRGLSPSIGIELWAAVLHRRADPDGRWRPSIATLRGTRLLSEGAHSVCPPAGCGGASSLQAADRHLPVAGRRASRLQADRSRFQPQHSTWAVSVSAHVWPSPELTKAAPPDSPVVRHRERGYRKRAPLPSWPKKFEPQHATLSVGRRARTCGTRLR